MNNNRDSHIPSPLIMFTCSQLHHALLEWQKNKGVHAKSSKSKLRADRPDHFHYFNYKNNGDKNASCCAATGHKMLTSPGISDIYIFLMNTWNTLPESYQHRAYKNTLARVKHQIELAEIPMPVVVIRVEEARVGYAILPDHLTPEVMREEPQIGTTDRNIPMDNNCTDDQLHFRMREGSMDYEDKCDESHSRDDILTASQQQQPATDLKRHNLGTSDVDRSERKDGHDADADPDEVE
jgi:hypothetical protein